jgi:hypothetical protein
LLVLQVGVVDVGVPTFQPELNPLLGFEELGDLLLLLLGVGVTIP